MDIISTGDAFRQVIDELQDMTNKMSFDELCDHLKGFNEDDERFDFDYKMVTGTINNDGDGGAYLVNEFDVYIGGEFMFTIEF